MRACTILLAAGMFLSAGAAWACPYQSVSRDQTVAQSSGPSTPIPAKTSQDSKS